MTANDTWRSLAGWRAGAAHGAWLLPNTFSIHKRHAARDALHFFLHLSELSDDCA